MSMRSIIKKAQVNLEGHDVRDFSGVGAAGSPSSHRRHANKKSARLIELDGVPRAVEVSCSCGEVLVIELDFEAK